MLSGRQKEIKEFLRGLELAKNNTGQVKVILGDYGVGKTFLLRTFKTLAAKHDFIISSFTLSDSLRINKTEDFYYALMHNLSIDNRRTSFEHLFNIWIDNLRHSPVPSQARYEISTVCDALAAYNQNYARAFTNFIKARVHNNGKMAQVTSSWLSGEPGIPHALKEKYQLVGYVGKSEALDNLKAFIKLITLLDFKGLVVFIDELDWILSMRSDIRSAAYHNIKQLVDLTTSGEIGHLFIVFSGTTALLHNDERGLLSSHALAQRLGIRSTAFEDDGFNRFLRPVYQVKPLENHALNELTHKTLRLYKSAYTVPPAVTADGIYEETLLKLSNQSFVTREFVSELIARLDEACHDCSS